MSIISRRRVVFSLQQKQKTRNDQVEKQAKMYDAQGEYVRHWLPGLGVLPTEALQVGADLFAYDMA